MPTDGRHEHTFQSSDRWWVSALIGPCTQAEAEEFTQKHAEMGDELGAVWGVEPAEFQVVEGELMQEDLQP